MIEVLNFLAAQLAIKLLETVFETISE